MASLLETLREAPLLPEGSDERKLKNRLAMAMLQEGSQTSPIQHWSQGTARLMNALMGGYMAGQQQRAAGREEEAAQELYRTLPGLGGDTMTGTLPGPTAATGGGMRSVPEPKSEFFDPGDTEMQAGLRTPIEYQPEVLEAAKEHNVDPMTLVRLLRQESGFNPNAVSPAGAQGIAQIMPGTARDLNVNPFDPKQAIPGAAQYFRQQQDRFGDPRLAAAAYNFGPGNVQRVGGDFSRMPAETQNYVRNVVPGGPQGAPPQGMPAGGPQMAQAGPQIPPQLQQTIRAMLMNPRTRAQGMKLYEQYAKPQQFGFQTLPDGTVVRTDPRSGQVTPVMQAQKPPTYGVIGKDQFGTEQYGWIDPQTRQVRPAAPGQSIPSTPAAPGGNGTIPTPPPGVDPKKWREEQTKLLIEQQRRSAGGETREATAAVVLDEVRRARELAKSAPFYDPAVGFGAETARDWAGGSNAANMAQITETIKANVGFDRLQRMREESPTGGALGQVAVQELNALQATLGSLSQAQSREQFLYNLDRFEKLYSAVQKKAAAYPNAEKYGFSSAQPDGDGWTTINGIRIREKR